MTLPTASRRPPICSVCPVTVSLTAVPPAAVTATALKIAHVTSLKRRFSSSFVSSLQNGFGHAARTQSRASCWPCSSISALHEMTRSRPSDDLPAAWARSPHRSASRSRRRHSAGVCELLQLHAAIAYLSREPEPNTPSPQPARCFQPRPPTCRLRCGYAPQGFARVRGRVSPTYRRFFPQSAPNPERTAPYGRQNAERFLRAAGRASRVATQPGIRSTKISTLTLNSRCRKRGPQQSRRTIFVGLAMK